MILEANHKIGGGWGNHINWLDTEVFANFNGDTLINVHGHKPEGQRPEVGDTLLGEFKKSFIKFKFVEVEFMLDPKDQFFGKVKVVEREIK